MTIATVYHISEKCRITDDGPEILREYRFGETSDISSSYDFLMGPYSAAGYPALGEQYAPDVEIFVSEVNAQRTGSDRETDYHDNETPLAVWKVTVKWKSLDLENKWEDEESDTCLYDVSVCNEFVDLDGRYDWSGNVNTNSAGEFYEDKLPIQASVTVIRFTEKALAPPNMALAHKVNASFWWGGAAGYWLCRNVSGEFVHNEKEQYWKNSYEFAYNPLNWQLKKLDSGYYHIGEIIVNGNPYLTRIRNTNYDGSENERPSLLNGVGELLPEGEEVQFRCFDIYESMEFPPFPNPLAETGSEQN